MSSKKWFLIFSVCFVVLMIGAGVLYDELSNTVERESLVTTEKNDGGGTAYQNGSEEHAPDPTKILEEMAKRLGGKNSPFGDIFGGGTGPFGGSGTGGLGPFGEIFKELGKNQQNPNNQQNPSDMLNDITKMLNDLFGNGPKR